MPRITRRVNKEGVFDKILPIVNATVDELRKYYAFPIEAAGPMKEYVINRLQNILDYGDLEGDLEEDECIIERAWHEFDWYHREFLADTMLDMLEEKESLQKYQHLVKQKNLDAWQRSWKEWQRRRPDRALATTFS